jgi:transposase-like protein
VGKGRPKGGTNKYWTKEEKFKIVSRVINDYEGLQSVAIDEKISNSQLHIWIKRYLDGGLENLENKKKPGNPLTKYQAKKNLTKEEQLEYENMKLRIENERLKKGYIVKGVGRKKEYISINNKNLK